MRPLLVTVGVLLAAAAPANGDETVANRPLSAGPVLAGDGVIWGGTAPRGPAQLRLGRPGSAPRVVAAWSRPRTSRQFRAVVDVAATAGRAAAVVTTCRAWQGEDAGPSLCANRAFAGPRNGPLRPLGAPLPSRGPEASDCRRPQLGPKEVALGDGVTAIAIGPVCPNPAEPIGGRIVIHRAGTQRTLRARGAADELRIAGRYLAWRERTRRTTAVVLHDLRTGRRVTRIGGRAFSREIDSFDVSPAGTLAVVHHRPSRSCVSTLARGAARPRTLACDVWDDSVAIAGRRVLYERRISAGFATALVLARHGAEPRELARFSDHVHRTYDVDFDGRRMLWATYDDRDGDPGRRTRIVIERL